MEDGESRRLLMEDVVTIKPLEKGLQLVDIFGEQRAVEATIKEVKLLDHLVLLEPLT